MPLIIRSDTPNWVKRAYRLVWTELGVDIRKMPTSDLTAVLLAALDHDKSERFREAVLMAARRVVENRYRHL